MSNIIHNLIVYHYRCPDGEMSAAIYEELLITKSNTHFVPWSHENKEENILCIKEMLAINHDRPIKPYIYFLDYCPDFEFVMEIINNVSKVIILDHHKSACEKFQQQLLESNDPELAKIEFIFKNHMSGCMLTWEYFHKNTNFPKTLEWIGKRDIWVWDDPNIEPFTSGYHLYCNIHNDLEWYERIEIFKNLLHAHPHQIDRIIEIGNNNLDRMREEAREICQNVTFEEDTDINDKLLKIVSVEMIKHHLTKYILEEVERTNDNYDVLKLVFNKDDKVVYSLRSLKDDVRVDLLAQKYGGNGHMKASGYSLSL